MVLGSHFFVPGAVQQGQEVGDPGGFGLLAAVVLELLLGGCRAALCSRPAYTGVTLMAPWLIGLGLLAGSCHGLGMRRGTAYSEGVQAAGGVLLLQAWPCMIVLQHQFSLNSSQIAPARRKILGKL